MWIFFLYDCKLGSLIKLLHIILEFYILLIIYILLTKNVVVLETHHELVDSLTQILIFAINFDESVIMLCTLIETTIFM